MKLTRRQLNAIITENLFGDFFGKNKEEKRELTELERVSEELGFDVERMDALGEWADKLIKKKQLPGVVIAVARKGRVVFHEAFGDRTYQRDSILAIEGMVTPVSFKQQLSCAGSVRLGAWIAGTHLLRHCRRFLS